MKNFLGPLLLISILVAVCFGCREDDDPGADPAIDQDLIGVTILAGTNSQVCLNEQQLELLVLRDIVSAQICHSPSISEVVISNIEQDGTCFTMRAAAGFIGELSDTLCLIHCYDGTPALCDTTLIVVTVEPSFQTGVFVINQGTFGAGNGSIGHYEPGSLTYTGNVYSSANGGVLGDVVQSMLAHNGNGYIVVNNSNKIEKVRLTDVASQTMTTNLDLPRYMCRASDDLLFISQWGAGASDGAVGVYDVQIDKITEWTTVGNGPDRMFCSQNNLFILNSGAFTIDSTVMVMDIGSRQITDTIVVGVFPNGIIGDIRGHIWVSTAGNRMDGSDGSLNILGVGQPAGSRALPNGAGNLAYDSTRDVIYYTAEGAIWKITPDGTTNIPAPEMFATGSYYGLNVDPATGLIYAADVKDFVSTGEVVVYDVNGGVVDQFDAGIVPSEFVFL